MVKANSNFKLAAAHSAQCQWTANLDSATPLSIPSQAPLLTFNANGRPMGTHQLDRLRGAARQPSSDLQPYHAHVSTLLAVLPSFKTVCVPSLTTSKYFFISGGSLSLLASGFAGTFAAGSSSRGIASSRSPVVFVDLVPPPVPKRQRCPEPAVVRVVDGVGLADKADPRPSVRHSPRLEVLRKLVCCAARPLPPLCPSTSPAAPLRIARGTCLPGTFTLTFRCACTGLGYWWMRSELLLLRRGHQPPL